MSAVETPVLTERATTAQWRLTRFVVLQPVDELEPTAGETGTGLPDDGELLPTLDDDGLLRHRGRWVAVPEAQLPLVRLLLDHFQTTVSDEALLRVFSPDADAGAPRRLAGALHRLRARVGECDLTLCRVRARGYILDHTAAVVGSVSEP